MHYRDGRPAKAGDIIKAPVNFNDDPEFKAGFFIGVLVSAEPKATTCNGVVKYGVEKRISEAGSYATTYSQIPQSVTLGHCEFVG